MEKLLFAILIFLSFTSYSQQPHAIKFTTSDGLPSNEIYTVFQDKKGYIWLGTDKGVCRYNGHQFENYGIDHGLKHLEINKIMYDANGKLWFSSYFGELYYFESDKFIPFQYNAVIKKYTNKGLLSLEYIDQKGTFYFNNQNEGVLMIDKDGIIDLDIPKCKICMYVIHKGENYIYGRHRIEGASSKKFDLIYSEKQQTNVIRKNLEYFSKNIITTVGKSAIISLHHKLVALEDGKITDEYDMGNLSINKMIYIGTDLYVCASGNIGIQIHRDWLNKGFNKYPENWMKDINVSDILHDRNGGYWITTLSDGLLFMPNPNVPVYLPDNDITTIAIVNKQMYAGTAKGLIAKINNNKTSIITKLPNYCNKFIIDEKNELIYTNPYKYQINNNTLKKYSLIPTIKDKKRDFEDSDYATVGKLLKLNEMTKVFKPVEISNATFKRIFDLSRDRSNTLWLATDNGIKQMAGQIFHEYNWPILNNQRINAIDHLSNDDLVLGTKGNGIIIGNQKRYIQLKQAEGLSSDFIENVWVDTYDNIWVATPNGLNKIINHGSSYKVLNYNVSHGLPSYEINDIIIDNKNIWIATNNGIALWQDTKMDSITHTPLLTKLEVNGKSMDTLLNLGFNDNTILFGFINFDFTQFNKINYRYRFDQNDWQFTNTNELKFTKMQAGTYNLEVQSQNKDQIWSSSFYYKFKIDAIFYKKRWFIILCSSILFLTLFIYYKNSMKKIKAKENLKLKIKDLENRAAFAQFNPHFIFNATSTIQYYIATKELKSAEKYLVDFTNLLRTNMENVNKKSIILSDELKHLDNYVQLEQRRFEIPFNYKVHIDTSVDLTSTSIPSMMLFNLYDDAINNRLMHKKDEEPWLKLNIKIEKENLILELSDNGIRQNTSVHFKTESSFSDKHRLDFFKNNDLFSISYETNLNTIDKDDQNFQILRIRHKN